MHAYFMLASLPLFIRLPLVSLLAILNMLAHATVLLTLALIKALIPIPPFRIWISKILILIAEQWIAVNGMLFGLFTRLSAFALLGMTLVIQTFVYPDAWPTHLSWAAILLPLVARGGGIWSMDALISPRSKM